MSEYSPVAGGLTTVGGHPFNHAVRSFVTVFPMLALAWVVCLPAQADSSRRPLPLDVARGAARAVDAMGVELVKGRVAVTLEKMYGPWKDRAARRLGGMDKLVQVVVERRDKMQEEGMQLAMLKAGAPTSGFEVRPVMKTDPKSGLKEVDHYQEWLVFVPTTIRYRVIESDTGKTRYIEREEFQVAVAKQGTDDWEFIDGSKLTIDELRTMFPTLSPRRSQLGMPGVGPWREPKKN